MPSSSRSLTGVYVLMGYLATLGERDVKGFYRFVLASFSITEKKFRPFDNLVFKKQ